MAEGHARLEKFSALQEDNAMKSRLFACLIGLLLTLLPVATFAGVTPYPAYPGATPSQSYKVTVNGQPVFVHHFLTYDQFNWMDYASFAMTGKVHVELKRHRVCLQTWFTKKGPGTMNTLHHSIVALLFISAAGPVFAANGPTKEVERIDGFRDTPMLPGGKWHLHDPDRPQPPVVTPGATFSQNAPAPAKAEATAAFSSTASRAKYPGSRCRSTSDRIPRRCLSNCRTTTIRFATATSGFVLWASVTNREHLHYP
jgi:hypothetical protein